jgi:hypothetical protein
MSLPVWALVIILGTLGSDRYHVYRPISGLTYEQCQMAAGQFMAAGPPPALPISFNCVRLEEI